MTPLTNRKVPLFISVLFMLSIFGCANVSHNESLFVQLGGHEGIANLTEAFIEQIQYNPNVMPYFLKTDVNRFRRKFIEQICEISKGPCTYTGDSMVDVHKGMDINAHHFNALVDDLILAMEKLNISTTTQNQLLSLLAPMREDIIYR